MQLSLVEKLKELSLGGMVHELDMEPALTQYELDAIERLVDAQLVFKHNRKSDRLRKDAKLKYPNATIAAIDYRMCPGLDCHAVDQLAMCSWIKHATHVIIQGEERTGKSFFASALASEAIANQFSVFYFDFPEMIIKLRNAFAHKVLGDEIKKLNKNQILILDDFKPSTLDQTDLTILHELIYERDKKGTSLIITSKTHPNTWLAEFENSLNAENICNLIVRKSHLIRL